MYIPDNKIIKNQYTMGKDFVLDNKPYVGHYNQIGNRFYTGGDYTNDSKQLTSLKEFLASKVKEKTKFNINEKYFLKKANESSIKIVSKSEYDKYLNNPLYTAVKVDKTNPQSIEKARSILPDVINLI